MEGICKNAHRVHESRLDEFIEFLTDKLVNSYDSMGDKYEWVKNQIKDSVYRCRENHY